MKGDKMQGYQPKYKFEKVLKMLETISDGIKKELELKEYVEYDYKELKKKFKIPVESYQNFKTHLYSFEQFNLRCEIVKRFNELRNMEINFLKFSLLNKRH